MSEHRDPPLTGREWKIGSAPRRRLVTIHLPIEMRCYAEIAKAVARAYPGAVVGEDGAIWDRASE